MNETEMKKAAAKNELLAEVEWRAANLRRYEENRDNILKNMDNLPEMLDPEFSRMERLAYAAHAQYYQCLVDLAEYSRRRLETKFPGPKK